MPTPRSDAKRWLSQAEAAEYLGVTTRTIRNMIRRGDLPGRRISGSRLVRLDRLELEKVLRPIRAGGR